MNGRNRKPEIVVFAGPNGSGKSTLTEYLKPLMDYINADEIKKNLKCSDLDAAQLAESQREQLFKKRKDEMFFEESEDWSKKDIEWLMQVKLREENRKLLNQ